jgi:hypothetical protein
MTITLRYVSNSGWHWEVFGNHTWACGVACSYRDAWHAINAIVEEHTSDQQSLPSSR